jgi:hypothetical protein
MIRLFLQRVYLDFETYFKTRKSDDVNHAFNFYVPTTKTLQNPFNQYVLNNLCPLASNKNLRRDLKLSTHNDLTMFHYIELFP